VDETVLIAYMDFPGEEERVQLDDPTTQKVLEAAAADAAAP